MTFPLVYKNGSGEERTILIDPQNPVFCERSGLEMFYFSATRTVVQSGPVEIRDQQTGEVIWRILPSSLGLPNSHDRLIFRAFERLAQQKGQDLSKNPMLVYEFREILQLLFPDACIREQVAGQQRKRIREAIRRIANQNIEVMGKYGEGFVVERGGARYLDAYGFARQKDPKTGQQNDVNYLVFGEFYCHSLNLQRPKPLYFEYLRQLDSPIAASLYERLQAAFWYGHIVRLRYSHLCQTLGIREQRGKTRAENRRRARLYLKSAHDELVRKHFLEQVAYENINGDVENPSDFWIVYHPGLPFTKRHQKTLALPEKVSSLPNEQTRALLARYYRKAYRFQEPERKIQEKDTVFLESCFSRWQSYEKILCLIDFAVKQYLPTQNWRKEILPFAGLKAILKDFESQFQQGQAAREKYRDLFQKRFAGKTRLMGVYWTAPEEITHIGEFGIQLGSQLETCKFLIYSKTLIHDFFPI